jgi:CubicO group peptidase (beta-lactamase class C family)
MVVVFLLSGCGQPSRAGRSSPTPQAASPAPPEAIAAEIRSDLEGLDGLGISVAVSRGGKLEWAAGFGSSDLALKVPAAVGTAYQIGSITKTFTAALVMQLVEEGKLALADRVGQFVHGLPWGRKVTIAELLSHTSGIVDYVNSRPSLLGPDCPSRSGSMARCPALTPAQVTGWLARHRLLFTPGTRFSYSNSNYYLLGLVLEKVTGEPYGTYLKRRILSPLGLSHTGPCLESMRLPADAVGYLLGKQAVPVTGSRSFDSESFAAGELCSTAGDLVKWMNDLAHGRVVSAKTYKEMATAAPLPGEPSAPYGYGLVVKDGPGGQPLVGHTGATIGYTTLIYHFPNLDLDVAVCTDIYPTTQAKAAVLGAARQDIVYDIVNASPK